jgi:hypothetical protein
MPLTILIYPKDYSWDNARGGTGPRGGQGGASSMGTRLVSGAEARGRHRGQPRLAHHPGGSPHRFWDTSWGLCMLQGPLRSAIAAGGLPAFLPTGGGEGPWEPGGLFIPARGRHTPEGVTGKLRRQIPRQVRAPDAPTGCGFPHPPEKSRKVRGG